MKKGIEEIFLIYGRKRKKQVSGKRLDLEERLSRWGRNKRGVAPLPPFSFSEGVPRLPLGKCLFKGPLKVSLKMYFI